MVTGLAGAVGRCDGNIRRFIRLQAAAGLVLMGAMTLAMLVKNTPLACACRARLVLEGDMRVGSTPVGVALALAIVAASLAAGVLGYLVLRFAAPLPAPQAKET